MLNHLTTNKKASIKSVENFLADFESALETSLSDIDSPVLSAAKDVVLGGGKDTAQLCVFYAVILVVITTILLTLLSLSNWCMLRR